MDHYAKFDRHVSRHDADTQLWADGGGAEEAVEHLEKFQDEDWQTLRAAYPGKDRLWRGCLASALNPHMGGHAQDILIAMIEDPDPEVAFDALYRTAFYCGVNANADGPFVDLTIRHLDFLERVKSTNEIIKKIRSVSAGCAPHFVESFRMLEKVIA